MDKVRIKLTLSDMRHLLDYTMGVRLIQDELIKGNGHRRKDHHFFADKHLTTTCESIIYRLSKAAILIKAEYKIDMPIDACYALLTTWTRYPYMNDQLHLQIIMGKLDMATS